MARVVYDGGMIATKQMLKNAIDGSTVPLYISPEVSNGVILTPYEVRVIELICTGHNTKAAALLLHVSPKTVEFHRIRIYTKTKIYDIVTLTHWALANKLIEPLFKPIEVEIALSPPEPPKILGKWRTRDKVKCGKYEAMMEDRAVSSQPHKLTLA